MRLLHPLALCLVLLIGEVLANSKSSDTAVQSTEQNLVGQLFKKLNLRDDNGAEDEQLIQQFISDLLEQEAVIRAALDEDTEQPLPPPTKPHLLQEYHLLKSMKNQIDNPLAQLINKLRKISGNMKKSFFEVDSKSKVKQLNEIGQQLLKLLGESWQISFNEIEPIKENESKGKMLKELAKCSAKFKWDYWQNGQQSQKKGQNYGNDGQNKKRILQLLYNLSNDGTNGLASADLKSGAKKRQQRKRRKRADDDDDTKPFWQTQRFWITIFVVVAALALLIIISCFCNRNINTHRGGSSTDEEHGYGSPRYDSSPAPYHGVQMHPVQPERPTYYNNPPHGYGQNNPDNYGHGNHQPHGYRQNNPDNYGHGQGGYGQSSDDDGVIEFGPGVDQHHRSRGRHHHHSNPHGYPSSYIPPAPGTEDEHHYGGGGGACTIQ
ncbi:hypothetical protein niasHT_015068 [Heterodera trifolii]|uniref:Uncharacterized protein n=1 Tax=Heterodera trifolii TaxID=157864 RepID=A0ABD2L9F5_9BILA